MRGKPRAGNFILLAIIAGFLAGIVHLFILRFEAGDSYPPYSSLRADPLGTKALYESLGSVEGMAVSRNYQQRLLFRQHSQATLLLVGLPASLLNGTSREEAQEIESFVLDGGRLVLLLYPEMPETSPPEKCGAAEKDGGAKDAAGKDREKDRNGGHAADHVALAERWKIVISREELPADADRPRTMTAVPAPGAQALTQPVSWHSSIWFESLSPDWGTLYERDGKPVIIERTYGKGTVLLASDSYFASNEAMVKERRPELLARLFGPNSVVIFDETHFGIQDRQGVVALGRKYRLHGLFLGLLLLAALFIWKNMSGLLPPGEGRAEMSVDASAGKDHLSGLAGLLRRMVPRKDILATCAEEWKKTNRQDTRNAAGEAALIGSIVEREAGRPARERDPLGAYRTIHKLLSERKRAT